MSCWPYLMVFVWSTRALVKVWHEKTLCAMSMPTWECRLSRSFYLPCYLNHHRSQQQLAHVGVQNVVVLDSYQYHRRNLCSADLVLFHHTSILLESESQLYIISHHGIITKAAGRPIDKYYNLVANIMKLSSK